VFFEINLKRASFHDNFVDRWRHVDAYGLVALIAD
jgi:hypothetical protein